MLDFNRGSGCTGPGWQPPDPVRLAAVLIAGMTDEQIETLVRRHLSSGARRQRRLDQRDAAIRALSEWMPAGSGREMAKRIAAELLRYAASGWRFERGRPAPDDPRRAALHQAMSLSGGPIGAVQVARIMAGARSRTAS